MGQWFSLCTSKLSLYFILKNYNRLAIIDKTCKSSLWDYYMTYQCIANLYIKLMEGWSNNI